MNDRGRNFVIGLVTIIALVGLSILLLQFGELDRFLNPSYQIQIKLNAAGMTRTGSAINLNGVRVGTVSNVELVDDPRYPVLVTASVEKTYPIPIGSTANVADAMIGSGGRVELELPDPYDPNAPTYPMDGTAVLAGNWSSLADSIGSQLQSSMTPVLDSLDSFNALAKTWTGVGERVDRMLDPALSDEPGSVASAIEEFNATLAQAKKALELAQDWLGDEQLHADVSSAAFKANRLLESAAIAVNNVTTLAEGLGNDANRLTDAVIPVTEQMSVTLVRVEEVLKQASQGDGTIGQLMKNPDLYRSLEEAARKLETTLGQLELLLQKIRDEGLQLGM